MPEFLRLLIAFTPELLIANENSDWLWLLGDCVSLAPMAFPLKLGVSNDVEETKDCRRKLLPSGWSTEDYLL